MPSTYTVEEGNTAQLRVVLRGQSSLDVSVTMNTRDGSALSEFSVVIMSGGPFVTTYMANLSLILCK